MERSELDAIVRAIIDRSELGILIRQLQASFPGLRVVRGTVSSAGAKLRGDGFTCSRTGVGAFSVTFDSAFTEAPSVVTTVEGTGALDVRTDSPVATTGFTTRVFTTTTGASTDGGFSFIAIGPQ